MQASDIITVLKTRHRNLSEKIEDVEARHERLLNLTGKRKLGMKIEDMLDNLNIYQQAITENLIERRDLEERFENDLKRYIELTPSE